MLGSHTRYKVRSQGRYMRSQHKQISWWSLFLYKYPVSARPSIVECVLVVWLLLVAASQHALLWSKLLTMRLSQKFSSSVILTGAHLYLGFICKEIHWGHCPAQGIITPFVKWRLCLFRYAVLVAATLLHICQIASHVIWSGNGSGFCIVFICS